MQSGGQSAGIQLQVGLDLAFFRSQLQKVSNIASSEFTSRLDIRFNKSTLDAELNNLQKAIKRRVYRVEIGGNIDTLPDKVKSLREQLSALESVKIDLGVGAVKSLSKKDASKINSELRAQVLGEQKKIYVPVSIKPNIVKKDVLDFKNAVQSKLSGITVKVKADLEAASISGGAKSRADINADVRRKLQEISEIGAQRMAGGGGGVTEAARRAQLKRSLETGGFDIGGLKDIGKQLGIANAGRYKNANSLINKIVTDASIEMVKKYLDPQAVMRNTDRSGIGKVLDTFARGIFNMLGMDPASIRAQQQASKPKPFAPAGLLPPAYRGIGPSAEPAGLLPPAYRGIGPSAKPAGLLPSLSSAGRGNAIIEALIASTGPRLLPSGGGDDSLGKLAAPRQTKDAVDAILRNYFKVVEAQVKEVFSAPPIKKESLNIFDHLDTEQYFNYLAQARINAENAIKRSMEEAKQVTKQNQIKDAAQSFLRALEEAVRNAERSAFTQSRIAANRSYVQRANIREIGQPLLGGKQVAAPKMLSAATGFYRGAATPPPLPETQAQLFARREREARMRSALRGVDVMGETPTRGPARYSYANRPAMPRRPTSAIVPYEEGGALVPSGRGGGGAPPVPLLGGGGGGSFGGMQFNVPKLPGAGLVREVGEEFGFAAKQVLLYGTAYKALGILQTFPAQVGEAVGALQSFRNTIGEISPSAKEAADSSQFILDIVDKYNTPLQSARDGFVKLYASMQPAGFSGDEIRDLFLGISQTAATFGMSADKVDRVNYAFAQMASKGQVMSEELKGQLGDVLPGAMAIFAEAAGFEGPEAITKFSKALEDGAYKGGAMKVLLTNVGSIMRKEFGPGAEGAARTFQGVMNRMQNSLKLLYETFEPVAVGFLNSVVMPMTSGLKTVTDGLNAFFTGTATKTTGGFAIAQELEKLRPVFDGLRANAAQLIPIFGQFAQVLLGVGKVLLQIAANPFVGYVARVYLNVLALTTAMNILNLRALIPFIANLARSAFALIAFSVQMIRAKQHTQLFGLMVQTAGTTLRTFFASTGVGLVLVGIGLLIERFTSMNQALADTKAKALGAADAIRSMSQAEARQAANQANHDVKILQALQQKKNKGEAFVAVTKEEQEALARAGITTEKKQLGGGTLAETALGLTPEARTPSELLNRGQQSVDVTQIKGALLQREGTAALANRQITDLRFQEQQTQQAANIAPIPPGGDTGAASGAGKGADKLDTYNRSTLDFIKLRLEAEKQSLDQRRQAGLLSETAYKIAVAELELESSKEEVAERLRLSRITINQDNLSAADKALKLKDTEIIAERELSIAANKRNIAVEGARKELEGPFNDAIDSANFSIMEQQMLLENIQNGIQSLTPDQQAYLQVLRLTTGKSEDELKLLVAKSNVTRQILEQEIAIKKQVDFEQKLHGLREEIKLLLIVNDAESRLAELRNAYDGDAAKAQQVFNLEEVKKNIEATRARIDDFVSSTASDYKGFLKAVISGEDAVDALKQFQAGLTDKVLTIFLDFTMAPVEKFFKESLGKLFLPKVENIPGLDVAKEVTKDPVQATNSNTNATNTNTAELKSLTTAIKGIGAPADPSVPAAPTATAGPINLPVDLFDPNAATAPVAAASKELNTALTTNIPDALKKSADETNKAVPTFQESLGKVTAGIGIAAGSIMGIAAGIGQIKEGGTSNVLGGIGSVLMSLGGAVGGFAGFFKGANGGVAGGGWKPFPVTAFANGGMVNGPTLGLVGEGKYNEAIVPLPDGRSIPVQMKGGSGLREAMNGNTSRAGGSPILNMSFQSTNINGVEYVSRDQLEQAMVATRRQAASDGAKRGMSMTLDKLQQSPSTRSRLGMGGR